MTLTAKQERFVEEYLIDLNATQAAIRAGYSEKGATVRGAELLANRKVAARVAEARQERSERTEVTQDQVLQELAAIGFLDPADLAEIGHAAGPADIKNLPEHVRRAIVGWNWDKAGNFTLKLASKTAALELIGRHLAMFTDRQERNEQVTVHLNGSDADL